MDIQVVVLLFLRKRLCICREFLKRELYEIYLTNVKINLNH